ncbi:iron-containing alcohol dehydrogenase [Ruminococcus sp.]|uniref:iron-containing alcohol dehydrogenase n=1 Tax=Ruminococcus sp. TaxID=41978 RepID=UPI0025E6E505|nr:iron-containing alcohol dehydrogenase [Ruminococcus sp.]MBQ8967265.1 iron-containing alcohol dehydrogenase [Ruminococcus sp.]
MNAFTYFYPVTTYFGEGAARKHLPDELGKYGRNVMLAYGGGSVKRVGIFEEIKGILEEAGKAVTEFGGIMPNPTYAKVQEGAALAREKNIDLIIALGGGSVIDACKIISAQALLDEDIWDFEYAKGLRPVKFIPMGAVVTAFGTGAEQNNGAVITHEDQKLKSALWGAYHSFAVLDPGYTMTMPFGQVMSGAFDSLSHCMETYLGTPRQDNLSDEINEAVMRNIIKNIRRTLADPQDRSARSELIWAAAMAENGILKIGKVTDFQCHMIEHQLGAYTDCNHGRGLAVLHPVLYRHIYKEDTARFARMAEAVWGISPRGRTEDELALAGIEALSDFIKEAGLPVTLGEMGIGTDTDLRAVAESTVITKGCCKKLTAEEIFEILQECL